MRIQCQEATAEGLILAAETALGEALRGAAAGSRDAFRRLVEQHQAMVYSIGLRFLRDAAAAEDIAQDVFLELHRNIGAIESEAHLLFWLRRVAVRKCIDHARKMKLRPRVGLEDAPEPAERPRESDPLLRAQVRAVVAALPANMRAAIVLRYQEEMEPAEIAQALGVPVGTVKSTLHRALEMLRTKLARRMER
jgi:RNA polymerase sigma-70 factor (ECF subfamily)